MSSRIPPVFMSCSVTPFRIDSCGEQMACMHLLAGEISKTQLIGSDPLR